MNLIQLPFHHVLKLEEQAEGLYTNDLRLGVMYALIL